MHPIKLTEYSHGAGCGCKISPALLDKILLGAGSTQVFPELLVGHGAKDDAAALDLGDGRSVLSTTDFFMPIVDDPLTFGRIAATNAISDIYAMGGKPVMAIAIFGWPIDKLSAEVAAAVIEGGRLTCDAAGIPLAGGHSIDAPEPIFGLAVTGLVENKYLKRNGDGQPHCQLFLTKPLGIGILTTAQKQKKIRDEDLNLAIETMCTLNKVGAEFAALPQVVTMTDVTGFGLLGHLLEICQASHLSAEVNYALVPTLPQVKDYLAQGCTPGGTSRNWQSYGEHIGPLSEEAKMILCDPQTSGGLLVLVQEAGVADFIQRAHGLGLSLTALGRTLPYDTQQPRIRVIEA